MAVSFEFEVDQYVVGYAWSTEIGNFRSIVLESTRRLLGTAPYRATLYFFPNGRPDRSKPIGSYRPEGLGGSILANLDLDDFEGVYAMLRSERPMFIRGGGTGDAPSTTSKSIPTRNLLGKSMLIAAR